MHVTYAPPRSQVYNDYVCNIDQSNLLTICSDASHSVERKASATAEIDHELPDDYNEEEAVENVFAPALTKVQSNQGSCSIFLLDADKTLKLAFGPPHNSARARVRKYDSGFVTKLVEYLLSAKDDGQGLRAQMFALVPNKGVVDLLDESISKACRQIKKGTGLSSVPGAKEFTANSRDALLFVLEQRARASSHPCVIDLHLTCSNPNNFLRIIIASSSSESCPTLRNLSRKDAIGKYLKLGESKSSSAVLNCMRMVQAALESTDSFTVIAPVATGCTLKAALPLVRLSSSLLSLSEDKVSLTDRTPKRKQTAYEQEEDLLNYPPATTTQFLNTEMKQFPPSNEELSPVSARKIPIDDRLVEAVKQVVDREVLRSSTDTSLRHDELVRLKKQNLQWDQAVEPVQEKQEFITEYFSRDGIVRGPFSSDCIMNDYSKERLNPNSSMASIASAKAHAFDPPPDNFMIEQTAYLRRKFLELSRTKHVIKSGNLVVKQVLKQYQARIREGCRSIDNSERTVAMLRQQFEANEKQVQELSSAVSMWKARKKKYKATLSKIAHEKRWRKDMKPASGSTVEAMTAKAIASDSRVTALRAEIDEMKKRAIKTGTKLSRFVGEADVQETLEKLPELKLMIANEEELTGESKLLKLQPARRIQHDFQEEEKGRDITGESPTFNVLRSSSKRGTGSAVRFKSHSPMNSKDFPAQQSPLQRETQLNTYGSGTSTRISSDNTSDSIMAAEWESETSNRGETAKKKIVIGGAFEAAVSDSLSSETQQETSSVKVGGALTSARQVLDAKIQAAEARQALAKAANEIQEQENVEDAEEIELYSPDSDFDEVDQGSSSDGL